uniref:Uncharacterized protein n=1 Tax=Abalone herpesvirus Taiwan/2005 TaxID=1821058 RepID=A0A145VUS5_9VIRU|nr:hypothetical protein tc2005_p063 [Abalone herpesvirus Taiwan/2005]
MSTNEETPSSSSSLARAAACMPDDLSSIDKDSLIKMGVETSSKILEACSIKYAPLSFGEILNGNNPERRKMFSLEGKRGQRSLKHITQHTLKDNDEIIESLNEICTHFINQQIISEHPELEDSVRELNFKNVLEPGRVIKIEDHRMGSYQIKDPCFNLYPSRVCFLEPYKRACGGSMSEVYKELKSLLERECNMGAGCLYRRMFPQCKRAGRVALPESVEYVFTKLLPACSNEGGATGLVHTLHAQFFSFAEECGKKKVQSVYKVRQQCIVCTMLKLSKETNKNAGLDRPHMDLYNEEDENIFLTKTEDLKDFGVIEVSRPDYNDMVVNVHGQKKVMVVDRSKLFSNIDMCEEDGFFFPVIMTEGRDVVPTNLPTSRKRRGGGGGKKGAKRMLLDEI